MKWNEFSCWVCTRMENKLLKVVFIWWQSTCNNCHWVRWLFSVGNHIGQIEIVPGNQIGEWTLNNVRSLYRTMQSKSKVISSNELLKHFEYEYHARNTLTCQWCTFVGTVHTANTYKLSLFIKCLRLICPNINITEKYAPIFTINKSQPSPSRSK